MDGMRFWKTAAAAAILSVAGPLVAPAPPAEAGQALSLQRFLVGNLEPDTGRFLAQGGRGAQNVFRDSVLLLVFSGPVDLDSLNERTVKIGIPTGSGRYIPAEGDLYRYSIRKFDGVSGSFVHRRTWRNRVLFDPLRRQASMLEQNPLGLQPETNYEFTIPGVVDGALKTVRSSRGRPMGWTFRTTFRTTDDFFHGMMECPPLEHEDDLRGD